MLHHMAFQFYETVDFQPDLLEELKAYCKSKARQEACGLLYGRTEGRKVSVTRFEGIRNAAAEPEIRFLLDPEEWVACLCRSDPASPGADGLVGIFHSHPMGPAIPSQEDMELQWNFPTYAILSFMSNEPQRIRCFHTQTTGQWVEQIVTTSNG